MSAAALATRPQSMPAATPANRAEVLAVITQAQRATCDKVSVSIYGEELCTHAASVDSAEELCAILLAQITEDARSRDASQRHAYSVVAMRGEAVVFKSTIRMKGGGAEGGGGVFSGANVEASSTGALKVALRSLDSFARLQIQSAVAMQSSLHAELVRATTRIEKLEADNDRLRAELRTARDATREQDLRAETERERQRMINHLGGQLLRVVPVIMQRMLGPIPGPKGAQEQQGKPSGDLVPRNVLRAFATLTDEQLGDVRPTLTPGQLEVLELARGGRDVTIEALGAFRDLSPDATTAILSVLRADQLEEFSSIVDMLERSAPPGAAPAGELVDAIPSPVAVVGGE